MKASAVHPHARPHRQQHCQHHQPQAQAQRRQQQLQPPPAADRRCCSPLRASPYFTTDTVTQEAFQEQQYESTQQGQRRKAWQAAVQKATGRRKQIFWQPELDSSLLLAGVTVVLVGPKKPISCGTIARSLSSFECDDLRVVQPRCQPNTRSSRSVSKGAQWILYRSRQFDSLTDALADADLSVALTRWLPDQPNCLPNLPSLLQQPLVQQLLQQPLGEKGTQQPQKAAEQQQQPGSSQQQHGLGSHKPVRLALVFGREEFGLSDEELQACDLACSIPLGRLQESLSLSHAVTIVLAQLYQARLSATAGDPLAAQYSVSQPTQLAEGYDSSGTEH